MRPSFSRLMSWEWRRLRREPLCLTLLALWLALLAVAAWQGMMSTKARYAEISAASAADEEAWSDKRARLIEIEVGRAMPEPFRDPRSPTNSVLTATADRPVALVPAPLAPLAFAASETAPALKRAGMLTKLYIPPDSLENPANRLAGRLDLVFVVGALLPLFVLALAFDVLARERELGIWPLLASQPTRVTRVVAARLGLHFVLFWLPLVLAAAMAALLAQPMDVDRWPTLVELGLWLALAAGYLIFWQVLAAWINFRGWSAAGNALALCGAWLVFVVGVPALVQFGARVAGPAPDHLGLVLAQRDIDIALHDAPDEVRAEFYARHGYQPPSIDLNEYDAFFVGNILPRAFATDELLAPVLNELHQRRATRAVRSARLAWLSPALAFRVATEQLAGVTPPQQASLIVEARRFQQIWRDRFGANLASMTPLALADYDTLPEPPVVAFGFAERLGLAWPSIFGVAAAAGLVALAVVRKRDPEME